MRCKCTCLKITEVSCTITRRIGKSIRAAKRSWREYFFSLKQKYTRKDLLQRGSLDLSRKILPFLNKSVVTPRGGATVDAVRSKSTSSEAHCALQIHSCAILELSRAQSCGERTRARGAVRSVHIPEGSSIAAPLIASNAQIRNTTYHLRYAVPP